MKNFGKNLKKLRTDRGISQEALAADLNLSRSSIAKYENELGLPSEDVINDINKDKKAYSVDDICKYFDVDRSYFSDFGKIKIHDNDVLYRNIVGFLISAFFLLLYVLWFRKDKFIYSPIDGLKLLLKNPLIGIVHILFLVIIPISLIVFIFGYMIQMYVLLFNRDKTTTRKKLTIFQITYCISILFFLVIGYLYDRTNTLHILYLLPHLD